MGSEDVPAWVVKWGDIAWRMLAIGAVVFFSFRVLQTISVVAISAVLALFLASILWSPVKWLIDRRWPPMLATVTAMGAAVLVLAGIFAFVIPAVASNFSTLSEDVIEAGDALRDWLTTGPLSLTEDQIDNLWETVTGWFGSVEGESILGGATMAIELITGAFLAVIVTFFVLKDGRPVVRKLIRLLPEEQADQAETGIRVAWLTLAQYMQGIALVGLFDALVIGIGLWIIGVPLVFPLAILVFFGAFFPLIGAFASGLVAVAVAFVNGGFTQALIVLALITAIQQFEGDVILPVVYGQTLKLHPLVILLGVAGGGIAFGLIGAFLTVPVIAVIVTVNEALSPDPDSSYISLARGI